MFKKKTLKKYGWKIIPYAKLEKRKNQSGIGSPSDIYMENNWEKVKYHLMIDDGNCKSSDGYVFHIYVGTPGEKIFEGRVKSKKEYKILMKMMGFKTV